MNKRRIHNVLFHLHTVSGIVISVVLYIIFFAGAFTMFQDEIKVWEEGEVTHISWDAIDFDKMYSKLEKDYNLTGRNLNFSMMPGGHEMYVYVDHSHESNATEEDLEPHLLQMDLSNNTILDYEQGYSFSEFIYRLHFLSQVPFIGMYLAGLVSFFFIFALLTGLYIHWDKLVRNFILFRTHVKWNIIWKDAHTVLGTIAFPYQLIFAITGAYFCLNALVLLPAFSLYGNDIDKLMNDMRPTRAHATWQEVTDRKPQSINEFVQKNEAPFENFEIYMLSVENINGTNMSYKLIGDLSEKVSFTGQGFYANNAFTLDKVASYNPYSTSYIIQIQRLLGRLHFGDFGGVYIKFVYAFLAFITCFIIISGVMIWLTARDKRNVPDKKRKFNRKVVNIYLAICLSMIPVTAIGLISSKFLPMLDVIDRETYYYSVYFLTWLVMSIYFIYKNNFQFTLKANVLLGGILFLLIPFLNGFVNGHWMWKILSSQMLEIFIVDLFSILVGVICLLTIYKLSNTKSV